MFFLITSVALGLVSYSVWLELQEQRELIAERDRIIERLMIQNLNDGETEDDPNYKPTYESSSFENYDKVSYQ